MIISEYFFEISCLAVISFNLMKRLLYSDISYPGNGIEDSAILEYNHSVNVVMKIRIVL